jgi:CheY-like chemotaxis protein
MPRAKIMVIEDNPSEVFLLRRALFAVQGAGFDLEIAADGETALQLIRSRDSHLETHPCVILLDLHLPQYDGLDILRAIRLNPKMNQVQVVVTTNSASPQEAEELKSMGIEYRLKPRNLAEFATLAGDLVAICSGSAVTA